MKLTIEYQSRLYLLVHQTIEFPTSNCFKLILYKRKSPLCIDHTLLRFPLFMVASSFRLKKELIKRRLNNRKCQAHLRRLLISIAWLIRQFRQVTWFLINVVIVLLTGVYLFCQAITYDIFSSHIKEKSIVCKDVQESVTHDSDVSPIVLVHGIFGFGEGVCMSFNVLQELILLYELCTNALLNL